MFRFFSFLHSRMWSFATYRSYSVSLDESRKPLANGFESIFNLVINWFWYAVTAVNTVSGNTNVLWSNSCNSFGVVGIFRPGYNRTKCIRGWYRCIEFNTIWNQKKWANCWETFWMDFYHYHDINQLSEEARRHGGAHKLNMLKGDKHEMSAQDYNLCHIKYDRR